MATTEEDDQIASSLFKDKVITEREYTIWYDMSNSTYGEGFQVNRIHGLTTRRLQQIAACVRVAISNRKIAYFLRPKDRSGKTVASGSHTRHVPDVTGDMRQRTEWSWQTERMAAFGKLDRWSRKR